MPLGAGAIAGAAAITFWGFLGVESATVPADKVENAAKVVPRVTNIWDGINALRSLQPEWNALDYGTTLEDGVGANEGVTADEVGAVVFATTDAFIALLATGHATNMSKLL